MGSRDSDKRHGGLDDGRGKDKGHSGLGYGRGGKGHGGEGAVREVAPRFTYHDYLGLTGDERYEVIEGELLLVPSPSASHQEILLRVATLLDAHVRQRNLGKVFVAPLDVVLSADNVLQPDVLFVAQGRLDIVKETHVAGAPDLVVEIESKSTRERDRVAKRGLYERFGAGEYWLIDPERKMMEVFDHDGLKVFTTDGNPHVTSNVLPDLALCVAELFS